jgi:hypothetical protein
VLVSMLCSAMLLRPIFCLQKYQASTLADCAMQSHGHTKTVRYLGKLVFRGGAGHCHCTSHPHPGPLHACLPKACRVWGHSTA